MLPRKYQLKGQIPTDFFTNSKKKPSPYGLIYYQLDEKLANAQIALIAQKKVFPLSSQRHQIKRKTYQALLPQLANFPKGKFVFILKNW